MARDEDINEGDTQFGRAAAEKADKADRIEQHGGDPTKADEGPVTDPRPRAGGKASGGAPPAGREDEAEAEEAGEESFPASDPPGNY